MLIFDDISRVYAEFADACADGSPCFEEWARGVLGDPDVQAWLATLPALKRQPNLVFAAARWHGVPAPGPYAALRDALLADDGTIRATILSRATQTNEVGRLATILPVLASLPGPLALVEVGASAGLCLYPDRYDYRWSLRPECGESMLVGSGGPTLRCVVEGRLPAPPAHPQIAWRAGVDLNPLDVRDDDAMAWLTNLVWPEQDDRRDRLRAAIEIARDDPPRLTQGNLLTELSGLVEEASLHGTPVVFHSAVAAYLDDDERERFQSMMTGLVADGVCHWISNEGKRVLPEVTATGPEIPEELFTFVLGLDGQAVAWTHGHGASMRWL